MSDSYIRDLLRVSVAQICQAIGYNSTQTTPLELLQDALHKFLYEFSRDLRRQVEHYNRTEANLNDTNLTLESLNININELLDYINNVEPVQFNVDVPKFPAHKDSNLNFLKPGSKEVLIRPVHIYEHLPPILPAEPTSAHSQPQTSQSLKFLLDGNVAVEGKTFLPASAMETAIEITVNSDEQHVGYSSEGMTTAMLSKGEPSLVGLMSANHSNDLVGLPPFIKSSSSSSHYLDEEGRPTREISSVVMTTGGFISPAIEGKLPDSIIPGLIEKLQGLDAPLPLASRLTSQTSAENLSTGTDPENMSTNIKNSENISNRKMSEGKNISSHNATVHASVANSVSLNPLSAANTAAAAWKKLHHLNTIAPQTPTMASRLLKKAKKKSSPNSGLAFQKSKTHRIDYQKNMQSNSNLSLKTKEINLDTYNILKDFDTTINQGSRFTDNINPAMVNALPPGLTRTRMEKLLKKQAKRKQKQLKQIAEKIHQTSHDITQIQQQLKYKSEAIFPSKNLTESIKEVADIKVQPTKDPTMNSIGQIRASSKTGLNPIQLGVPPQLSRSANEIITSITSDSVLEPSNEKKLPSEIKLSNEPDRSKLNIFKKISKQKSTKSMSPSIIYGNDDNKVINLPSGTTITPTIAPNISELDVGSDSRVIEGLSNDSNRLMDGSIFGVGVGNSGKEKNVALVNKPKKRGRKPGSKNQSKIAGELSTTSSTVALKKSKKFKNNYDGNFPLKTEFATTNYVEPLNLTDSGDTLVNKFVLEKPDIPTVQWKEHKETKKMKNKNASATVTTIIDPIPLSTLNVPTNEEVNSINEKLMRIDTVLKPAPPFLPRMSAIDFLKSAGSPSSIKSKTSTKSPGVKKQKAQQRTSPNSSGNLPAPNFDASLQKHIALDVQMFKMMSLYRFPPQPGLIPTPGLYPNFPNSAVNMAANASNMQHPLFLPLSKLKSSASSTNRTASQEFQSDAKNDNFKSIPHEGSYCNVAPLVPDYMKFTSLSTKSERHDYPKTPKVRKSPTQNEIINDMLLKKLDAAKSPESGSTSSKSIPTTPGGISLNSYEEIIRRNANINRLENALPSGNVATDVLVNTLSKAIQSSNTGAKDYSLVNKHNSTTAINPDEPIEVSDDSADNMPIKVSKVSNTNKTNSIFPIQKPKFNQNFIKSPSDSTFSTSLYGSEIFTPNSHNNKDISITNMSSTSSKEIKKHKKTNKMSKKNSFLCCPVTISNVPDLFAGNEEAGVGKLAGGADLIPLAGTGLAYSSKTVPATSLTAAATPTTTFPAHKREFETKNVFDNFTIIPTNAPSSNSDFERKHKEHKKFKKLKDGKIKKKKDKKYKSKNKERIEKHMERKLKTLNEDDALGDVESKNLFKKCKKERKKEKQRIVMDSLNTTNPTTSLNLKKQCIIATDAHNEKPVIAATLPLTSSVKGASALNTLPSTANTISPASTLVPKLTLKLGGSSNSPSPMSADDVLQQHKFITNPIYQTQREKREPSPELAKISPLVTRPPKQKLNTGSDAGINNMHTTGLNGNVISAGISGVTAESLSDNKTPTAMLSVSKTKTPLNHSLIPPPSPWLSGGTLTASSVLLPQQLFQTSKSHSEQVVSNTTTAQTTESSCIGAIRTNALNINISSTSTNSSDRESPVPLISEKSRPSSYIDAEGNRVWICPACGKVDDGSAMIGCDGCDAWYHWVCVGIYVAPKDNEDWFCRVCITRKKGMHIVDKKRKRNKKKQ